MDELLRDFLVEAHESLDTVDTELVRFEQEPNNAESLALIFRLVHTVKGTCGFLGLPRLAALAHAAESLMGKFRDGMPVTSDAVTLILATLDRIKDILAELERHQSEPQGSDSDLIAQLDGMAQQPAADTSATPMEAAALTATQTQESKAAGHSIRVNVDTLEHLMTVVSELVLTRNQLVDLSRHRQEPALQVPLQRLSQVTAELQDSVMRARMQPIGQAWQKLPRLVRDLSAELGKPIDFEMQGADTELDRQVLDLIKDPITHMVRNAADHGIERPAERRAAGKPEKARIRIAARHESGYLVVEIADDGRGLDRAKIAAKALSRGLVTQADLARMSDAQIQRFILVPGMSTASTVTSLSGRGVGMDVVQTNIGRIGGAITLHSVQGHGCTIAIRIPLTLAIISALIVEAAGERFALPQACVMELVRVRPGGEHRIEYIKAAPILRLRNRLLPLIHLRSLLRLGEDSARQSESGFVIVTRVGAEMFGIVVDSVFHAEDIVVKPLASMLRHIPAFSGATILGDGAAIMILNADGIATAFGSSPVADTDAVISGDETAAVALKPKTSLLVFRAGEGTRCAVPLSLVTRIEEVEASAITPSGDRYLVQYRGGLMPLIKADADMRIKDSGRQPLIVFSDGERTMGLLVDAIIDIVDAHLDGAIADARPGVLGSAIVNGETTDLIDIAHYMPLFSDTRSAA